MAEKPTGPNFVERINAAVTACKKMRAKTDRSDMWMLRNYVSGYGNKISNNAVTGKDQHPLNMIDRIVSIWLPFLISGNPKVIIKPRMNMELQPIAYTFQLALNQWMKEVRFDCRTLEIAVFNSLFSLGITKSGTHKAGKQKISGYLTDIHKPFSEIVDKANYIFDIVAMDREQYEFEGDEYLLPTDEAKEMFPKFADSIKPDFKLFGDNHPKNDSEDKPRYSEYKDYTSFIDLWLPGEKVIVTLFPPQKENKRILKTTDYKGHETGPYDVLGYKYYRGSTMPIPPIYTIMELDAAINTLYCKAREGAESMKKIGIGEAGDEKDLETLRTAKNAGFYGLNNANAAKEINLGGVQPEVWDFLGYTQSQLSEQGGITGLDYRMRSKTATQERMMMANSSRTLDMMSQKVHIFAKNIIEKIAFEMWNSPTFQSNITKKMAGIGEIAATFNQLTRKGKFPGDYYLDIEMYSMQKLSPDEKFQKQMQLLTGWVLPTMQLSVQQGKIPNVPEITKDLSMYLDLDIDSWFLSDTPQQAQLNPYQQLGSGGMKSSDTRFGSNPADNANNALAQMNSRQGATTRSM